MERRWIDPAHQALGPSQTDRDLVRRVVGQDLILRQLERHRDVEILEHHFAEPAFDLHIGGDQQGLLVLVVDVEGGRRDPGLLGDLGDAAGGEADLVDQFDRGLEQGLFFVIISMCPKIILIWPTKLWTFFKRS
mgnify:CR=1 FL=1